jgi:hypothetical protein
LTRLPTNLAGTEGFLFGSKQALADDVGCEIHVGAEKNAKRTLFGAGADSNSRKATLSQLRSFGIHVEMLTKRFPNLSREAAWILVSRYFNKKT